MNSTEMQLAFVRSGAGREAECREERRSRERRESEV